MRKKLLTVTLTIFMVFSLAACGSDKKDSNETETMKTVAEETSSKETVKEPVTKEAKGKKCQLTQMNSGFYGGIAWATVTDDKGSKEVLINKDLKIVYELPNGMEAGDIFNGKAVVIQSDQDSNPGFMILGADGNVLYKCSDSLGDEYDRAVSLTKDGGVVYGKKEKNGLTAGSAYACVLDDKFKTVAQIELEASYASNGGQYFYLSDGVYCCRQDHGAGSYGEFWYMLNAKDNIAFFGDANCDGKVVYSDVDRCVGFQLLRGDSYFANGENLDYTDMGTLEKSIMANGKKSEVSFVFNHGFISCDRKNNYMEGFDIPDFGAEIKEFKISNDGKYVALKLHGADSNDYYTVINSDGKSLYEPVKSDKFGEYGFCVCDGYIMDLNGNGITPDGKVFKLGDGTALSGIGKNSVAFHIYDNYNIFCMISDGYIVCKNKLYQLDGKEVTTVVTTLN